MSREPEVEAEACEHDWHRVDASFDHAFGREVVIYQECAKCQLMMDDESDWRDYE